ncbi:DNA/RNA non-specific endonuclease [Pararobbsia silviterrae]|uniref:DNA/RNA non-specific endonuclease n=1 Tax=Pararobbsia silviterrae TaxID=1792498 RepID=UPI0013140B80|nr:DNA/RNA non-specific endonuclease [Pararobbsia silviterrae]
MTDDVHLLCFRSFTVLESGTTRTAVWSAEALTRDHVLAARELRRDNVFHAEDAIAPSDRAELGDYVRSGWDRGHMTPSGDMPDAESQAESFSLANMIPQAPRNNRRLWEHIEASTRTLAKSAGEVYVVTGPGYTSAKPSWLNGRVRIPDLVWKAVYVPHQGAGAYLVRNDAGRDYAIVSIADMTRLTGIDPFPSLAASMRQTPYGLPSPTPHRGEDADVRVAVASLLGRGETVDVASSRDGAGVGAVKREGRRRRRETAHDDGEDRASAPLGRRTWVPIDILATLESAIEQTGQMLWQWLDRAWRDALR